VYFQEEFEQLSEEDLKKGLICPAQTLMNFLNKNKNGHFTELLDNLEQIVKNIKKFSGYKR